MMVDCAHALYLDDPFALGKRRSLVENDGG